MMSALRSPLARGWMAPCAVLSSSSSPAFAHKVLNGSCSCGSCVVRAVGESSLNFICHCSICRAASGKPSLPAVGFRPDSVTFNNTLAIPATASASTVVERRSTERVFALPNGLVMKYPPNSRNARFFCGQCSDYLGEDATATLGLVAIPLSIVKRPRKQLTSTGPDYQTNYQPQHHIFYADRVADVNDHLAKWATLPQGVLLHRSTDESAYNFKGISVCILMLRSMAAH